MALLLAGAPAHADVTLRDVIHAQRVASSYFTPKCEPVALSFVPLASYRLGYVTSLGGIDGCVVTLNTNFQSGSYEQLCSTMVHEYGHLAGYDHSTSKRSVMYPTPTFIPRRCRQR